MFQIAKRTEFWLQCCSSVCTSAIQIASSFSIRSKLSGCSSEGGTEEIAAGVDADRDMADILNRGTFLKCRAEARTLDLAQLHRQLVKIHRAQPPLPFADDFVSPAHNDFVNGELLPDHRPFTSWELGCIDI